MLRTSIFTLSLLIGSCFAACSDAPDVIKPAPGGSGGASAGKGGAAGGSGGTAAGGKGGSSGEAGEGEELDAGEADASS